MIYDSNAFQGMVDFVNIALSDTISFNTIEYQKSKEYFNAYWNYLYVPQNTAGLIVSNVDTISVDLTLTNINGTYFINSNNIRKFIDSTDQKVSDLATQRNFSSNSELSFKSIFMEFDGDIVNNSIPVNIYLFSGEFKSNGCSFESDFPNRKIGELPTSNDGSCYKLAGQNFADRQIRAYLNNLDCNELLGCYEILDLTPQTGDYTNGPYSVYKTNIAFSTFKIHPPNDWTLWSALYPNPVYECLTPNEMQAMANHCMDVSALMRPNYNVPNSSISINKSIDYYIYDNWYEDEGTIDIPLHSYYHFCSIWYSVCMNIPIYPIAIKNYTDWRNNL